MIHLYTDFGVAGPYNGMMRSVLMRTAPGVDICDLMFDAPDRNPKAASYLLAGLRSILHAGDVLLGVIDPGVGGSRMPLIVCCDGIWFVGPDNGLFEIMIRRSVHCRIWRLDYDKAKVSSSFHGRDVFAPAAAMIAAGDIDKIQKSEIDPTLRDALAQNWPDNLAEVIYVDPYGNLLTGLPPQAPDTTVDINGNLVNFARTFSDVPQGAGFHYANSLGQCEISVNCGRADVLFEAAIGTAVIAEM